MLLVNKIVEKQSLLSSLSLCGRWNFVLVMLTAWYVLDMSFYHNITQTQLGMTDHVLI